MSINLLDVLKNQMSGDLVNRASQFLGEDNSAVQRAMNAVLPCVLGGVASQGSSVSGASNLLNMLSSGGHDGSIFSNLSSLMGGGSATQGLVSSGSSIIRGLFGDKTSSIVDAISSHAGVKSSSASSLLSMAAPMVLGMLGNHINSTGTTASGLSTLLSNQMDAIKSALPASISQAMGLHTSTPSMDRPMAAMSGAAQTVKNTAADVVEETGSAFNKWLPWLLLLAAAALAWYFMRSCNSTPAPVEKVTVDTVKVQAPVAVVPVVQMDSLKLSDGTMIVVKPNSFLEALYKEVADPKSSVGVKLQMEGVNFATGSAVLSDDTKPYLDDLAHIMKAYPKLAIEIDGYTDNVGAEAANKKLSADRAHAVDAYLDTKGIAADRVTTKGMGSANPIADNATEDGKAKNRRFEAVITKE